MNNHNLRAFVLPVAFLVAVIIAFPSPSKGQTEATTDPVGFLTMNVAGMGAGPDPGYTFTTIGLTNPTAHQSTTTSVAGGSSIVDPNSTWADNAFNGAGPLPTHYVEILSGPGAGTVYDITATTASTRTLTLATPLLSGIVSGASYKVRPHWTIARVFGATNQNGLSGGNATGADQVQLFNGAGYVAYYYQTSGIGGTGWRRAGAPTVDASATIIYPDDGILIVRKQSANAGASTSVVIQGTVKTGQTQIPLATGLTLVGNVYAAAMTLGSSNLYTGNNATGVAGGNATSADKVLFWNGTGFVTFYYQTSGIGGTGWRRAGAPTVDATTTSIPVGAGLFINRTGSPFYWVAPQTPASFN